MRDDRFTSPLGTRMRALNGLLIFTICFGAPVVWVAPYAVCYALDGNDVSTDDSVDAGSRQPTLCDDTTFCRRVYLDLWGRYPNDQELRQFLSQSAETERSELVDQLLAGTDYGKKWGAWLTRMFGANREQLIYTSGETGLTPEQLYSAWLTWTQDRLNRDVSYFDLAANCICATGRDDWSSREYREWLERLRLSKEAFASSRLYSEKSTNDIFWRRYLMSFDSEIRGEEIAQRVLGVNLTCARCHDHPNGSLTQSQHRSFAAIFSPIRYSEFTLTEQQKHVTVWIGVTAILIVLVFLVFLLLRYPSLWSMIPIAAIAGFGLYIGSCYVYLLIPGMPKQWTFAEWGMTSNVAAVMGVMAVVLVVVLLLRKSPWARAAGILLTGFLVGVSVDSLAMGFRPASSGRSVSIVHQTHRELLSRFEIGGVGQFPRETFVDVSFASATHGVALDGTSIPIVGDPRRQLMDWLRKEDVHVLESAIVERVLRQYFPSRKWENKPLAGFGSVVELTREFRRHDHSMKWLHRSIVLSPSYQAPAQTTVDDAFDFEPRPLDALQILASMDAISETKTVFDATCLPPDGSAYDLASDYPFSQDLGGALIRLFPPGDEPYVITSDAALCLISTDELRERFVSPSSWIYRKINEEWTDERILRGIFLMSTGRDVPDELLLEIQNERSDDEPRVEFLAEVLISLINSDDFLILR